MDQCFSKHKKVTKSVLCLKQANNYLNKPLVQQIFIFWKPNISLYALGFLIPKQNGNFCRTIPNLTDIQWLFCNFQILYVDRLTEQFIV